MTAAKQTETEPISPHTLSRREVLALGGLAAVGVGLRTDLQTHPANAKEPAPMTQDFRICLNTSTIRGQGLPIDQVVDIAAETGFTAIEPWLRELNAYVAAGGSLADLRKRIEDHGLTVESAIGFANWISDDDETRAKGLEEARRDMDLLAQIGGKRIAAPPSGAPGDRTLDILVMAERYRALLEIGDETGVTPQVEMWGGSRCIGRVSTAVAVAIECGHPKACFLGDVFHAYKGGCPFEGLLLLSPQALQVFHMNDYPAEPKPPIIGDDARVFPGDGIAPLSEILRGFRSIGAAPVLSLELFNPEYWARDAREVAREGFDKTAAAVAAAMA